MDRLSISLLTLAHGCILSVTICDLMCFSSNEACWQQKKKKKDLILINQFSNSVFLELFQFLSGQCHQLPSEWPAGCLSLWPDIILLGHRDLSFSVCACVWVCVCVYWLNGCSFRPAALEQNQETILYGRQSGVCWDHKHSDSDHIKYVDWADRNQHHLLYNVKLNLISPCFVSALWNMSLNIALPETVLKPVWCKWH